MSFVVKLLEDVLFSHDAFALYREECSELGQ